MSAYLGRRGFELLRARLSERDMAIVESISEHRFVTARQIEELHFSEHSSDLAGARVCRRVLARLNRDRVVARLVRRVGGIRAGSASYVYALGPIGSRLLDDGRRRLVEPSALFLDHTLAVAETHVQLVKAARIGQLELASVEVEPRCWRRYLGASGAPEIVRPDLYVVTTSDAFEDCWFLEVDRGTESPAALIRKCRAYETYWRSGAEQQTWGAFPIVVWIVPNPERQRRIEVLIARARSLKRELFRVTTDTRLVELLAGGVA